jgi:hypothetical protein
MPTKSNEPAEPKEIEVQQSLTPAQIKALERKVAALQTSKRELKQERADFAEQTKKDAERSQKAEEESALIQRGLEDLLPDQEPPLIGAATDKQKQKAWQQYRDQTLAESNKFRTAVKRIWKDSANTALPLVASAAKEQKRQVLVDQADSLLASPTGERAQDSIIVRCQKAQNIRGVSIECLVSWSTADVRADLARAVIPNFDFEFVQGLQPPKRDPHFYHQLTQDWMRDVYAGYDRTVGTMLDGAPAWAALDDGRTLAQQFENDRKKIRFSSEPPEVKDEEIAKLDRAEKKGRCTPDDTRHLWNEIAEKLESAIEYRAVPDARHYLKLLVSVDRVNEAPQAKPNRRRPPIYRELDSRKLRISKLKAQIMGISSRKICVAMDEIVERASIPTREALKPLESWTARAGGKRMWVELYDDPRTRNVVKKYINELPAALQRRS